MTPWKAALATMVIFVCGLITGVVLEKHEGEQRFAALEAAGASLPPPILSTSPTTNFVTRTNVVWATAQAQRVAFLRQMVNRLQLGPEQHARILGILKESQERSKLIWQEIAPEMRDELKRTTDEIRQQLSPEQQRHFAELLREHRQENRARMMGTNAPQFRPASAAESATNQPNR